MRHGWGFYLAHDCRCATCQAACEAKKRDAAIRRAKGEPQLLEVNPLPGHCWPTSILPASQKWAGAWPSAPHTGNLLGKGHQAEKVA